MLNFTCCERLDLLVHIFGNNAESWGKCDSSAGVRETDKAAGFRQNKVLTHRLWLYFQVIIVSVLYDQETLNDSGWTWLMVSYCDVSKLENVGRVIMCTGGWLSSKFVSTPVRSRARPVRTGPAVTGWERQWEELGGEHHPGQASLPHSSSSQLQAERQRLWKTGGHSSSRFHHVILPSRQLAAGSLV